MKKTFVKLGLVLVLMLALFALAACNGDDADANGNGDAAVTEDPIVIGIIQIVEHPALDAAREGFIDGMAEAGFIDGENVIFDFQNAQGDHNTLSTIADGFISRDVDLILAIATPSAQAVAAKTDTIPIVGTAITSYERAELVDSNEVPGGNVTGTTDMNPVADQIDLAVELVPDAETIGLIYSAQEANSVYQVEIAKAAIAELGLQYEERTVENTNDVQQAMASLVRSADVIYLPTDNVLASAMAIVAEVANEAGIATVCGEINMMNGGGLATKGIDYFDLGKLAASMAVRVLDGEDPAVMPIETVPADITAINAETVEILGITIPERLQDYVVEVVPED
ncbi:MAG: ABC transporter substrate-binding protein [Coriobacteriia bacterium]|nr:ABC transporter substrate-binding protein [Coriobacteriia bacterium]